MFDIIMPKMMLMICMFKCIYNKDIYEERNTKF